MVRLVLAHGGVGFGSVCLSWKSAPVVKLFESRRFFISASASRYKLLNIWYFRSPINAFKMQGIIFANLLCVSGLLVEKSHVPVVRCKLQSTSRYTLFV
jgi:hypothetical protein